MKSKTLLMGMSALLVSVAGANAMEYKPFVGATMGIQGNGYDDKYDTSDIDLPHDFISFGLETGVRFGAYNQIYNGGFTLSADTSSIEKIENEFTDTTFAKVDTTILAATYDNYVRVSGDKAKRIDLVLGGGIGAMDYHINYRGDKDTQSIWSTTIVLKAGVDFELTKHLTLSATTRILFPLRDDYAIDASYIAGGAVKYVF